MGMIDQNSETNPDAIRVERPIPTPPSQNLQKSETVSHEPGMWTYRHSVPVRAAHWINAVSLVILIMSGLQIFNAHPALYWGDRSDRDQALLAIRPVRMETGEIRGITTVLGHRFDTTGVLGYSNQTARAFPAWATIPGPRWLAMGRQWHLFFAWIFVITGILYVSYAFLGRHLSRDLLPTRNDLRGIGRGIKDHLLLHRPEGERAGRYNVLQKLAYIAVLFVLAPLVLSTGLSMSPMMDAAFPWLLYLFGGRQGARTIHFITCFGFVGFIVIHVVQVIITGFSNNMRSMLTGWFAVKGADHGA
jgi:thiosulfate reductase cytochrome b subunit